MLTLDDAPRMAVCAPLPEIACTLPFLGSAGILRVGRDDRQQLLAAPYSSTRRSRLFVIALPGGQAHTFPLDDTGVAVMLRGPDGCAYLGLPSGRLLRYDPDRRALTEMLQLPAGEAFTAGWGDDASRLVFGTSARLLIIAPATGAVVRAMATAGAVTAVVGLGDGRLFAFMDGAPSALCLHPDQDDAISLALPALPGAVTHVIIEADGSLMLATQPDGQPYRLALTDPVAVTRLPGLPDDEPIHCLRRVKDTPLAAGAWSGGVFRWDDGAWRLCGTPMPSDPLLFTALDDGRIAGVTYQGRLVQSTVDWHMFALAALPNRAPGGMHVRALQVGVDHKLYFTLEAGMRLGCWDPAEDDPAELGVAAPHPGEVGVIGVAGERLYLGYGAPCGVMSYYPDLPMRLLENPKPIGLAGVGYRQPVGRMVSHHGTLYFAAHGDHDDAIVAVMPIANRLQVYPDILPGHALTSLIADRLRSQLLAGGRRRHAGAPARLACWSPETARVEREIIPFPEAEAVYVWAAEGGRAYVTDGGARFAIVDTTTGAVLTAGDFPLGPITSLIATQHGELYGLAGGWLFALDPAPLRVTRLAEAAGTLLTELYPGLFAFTREGGVFKVTTLP